MWNKTHGPRLTHPREIAAADMQMLCNIFSNLVIATNEQIIIWAGLGFEEEKCFCFFLLSPHFLKKKSGDIVIYPRPVCPSVCL